MGKNRLELRRMAEAAEKQKTATGATDGKTTKKRKAATKRKTATRKTKDRARQRKRVVWCVFNGSMKEEGRFPYDQKEAAEAKLELLRSKSKKLYFLQPVKEAIGDVVAPTSDALPMDDELEEAVIPADGEEDEDEDAEVMEEDEDEVAEEIEDDDEE
jgi:hypothetical protein